MNKVALLILFNHNYERNLVVLENLYKARFSNIFFIMPFYQGNKENVLPVYGNSYFFQGYIAQALTQLKNKDYENYLIIGDDLLLNPAIDEKNYTNFFKTDYETAFIPGIFQLKDPAQKNLYLPLAPFWQHTDNALKFNINQPGVEAAKFLPSYNDAVALLQKHGIDFSAQISKKMFLSNPILKIGDSLKKNYQRLRLFKRNFHNLTHSNRLPYPLVASYSDILVLPKAHTEKFILYSGIFSTMNLFVEIALPSALAYSMPKIISEADLSYKGMPIWEKEEIQKFETKYNLSIKMLLENFPENCLYVHPIKFSKWK